MNEILLPGFYWPEAWAKIERADAPHLHRLLAHAQCAAVDEPVWSRLLWQCLGGQGDLPLAKALLEQQQVKHKQEPPPQSSQSPQPQQALHTVPQALRADPVHIQLGRDDMSLANPFAVPLSEAEAKAILASLNAHLREDEVQLQYLTPRQWLLLLPSPLTLHALDPWAAVGRAMGRITPFSCADPQQERWLKRLLTEVQMLLHHHPVNLARQEQGLPVINSLWCWAGGENFIALKHELITDCVNAQTVVDSARSAYPAVSTGGKIFYLTGLMPAFLSGDYAAWKQALAVVDAGLAEVKQARVYLGDGQVHYCLSTQTRSWWQRCFAPAFALKNVHLPS